MKTYIILEGDCPDGHPMFTAGQQVRIYEDDNSRWKVIEVIGLLDAVANHALANRCAGHAKNLIGVIPIEDVEYLSNKVRRWFEGTKEVPAKLIDKARNEFLENMKTKAKNKVP